ncbi:hypothetical protein RIR_jg22788.t2 [Rhizophagus irregularis DAOM 181602=DAOM 197198]|nr:hypothetical protein RIR_jg22788.t2 [Rhizophagus irregularis DAOM 181602=DAOM 197198]
MLITLGLRARSEGFDIVILLKYLLFYQYFTKKFDCLGFAKYPGHRFKQPINDDKATIEASGQECEVKEAVKNTTSTTKHPARRPAGVNQSNNDSV